MLKIQIASLAGFCMGVRRAVNLTLEESREYRGNLYTLGALIHNPQILELLERRGIGPVKDLAKAGKGKVIIRAHGVPPSTIDEINEHGLEILDATCPHVSRIHRIIRRQIAEGNDIVIVGDRGHAEVVGLEGSADGRAHVVGTVAEADALPNLRKPCVVAQTTQSVSQFKAVADGIRSRFPDAEIHDTICRSTESRQKEMVSLSKSADLTIVVGGKSSANTQRLVDVVRQAGNQAIAVQEEGELGADIIRGKKSILVAAGASTPNWMIHRIVRHLRKLDYQGRSPVLRGLVRASEMFGGAYLGLGLVAMALASAVWGMAGESFLALPYYGIVFSYIVAMYALNHLTSIEAGQLQEVFKFDVVNRVRPFFVSVAISAMAAALGLAFTINSHSVFLTLSFLVAGILYNTNVIPAGLAAKLGGRRIKDIPLSKDLGISFGWTSVIVFLPLVSMPLDSDYLTKGAFLALVVAGISFLHALVNDLQDVQKDMFVGRETIPILLGKKKVWWVANTINALVAAALLSGFGFRILGPGSLAMLLLPFGVAVLLYLHHHQRLPKLANLGLAMEVMMGVAAVLVLVVAIPFSTFKASLLSVFAG